MDQTAVEVLFRRFGTCTGCKFFKTAAVPFAFIRLSTPAEALAAIKAMNGTTVTGKVILVKPADTDATYDTPNGETSLFHSVLVIVGHITGFYVTPQMVRNCVGMGIRAEAQYIWSVTAHPQQLLGDVTIVT